MADLSVSAGAQRLVRNKKSAKADMNAPCDAIRPRSNKPILTPIFLLSMDRRDVGMGSLNEAAPFNPLEDHSIGGKHDANRIDDLFFRSRLRLQQIALNAAAFAVEHRIEFVAAPGDVRMKCRAAS